MKSTLFTLIIFIIVFVALKGGVLDIIDSSMFHYLSVILCIAVFVAAYFIIGFQEKNTEKNDLPLLPNSDKEAADDQ